MNTAQSAIVPDHCKSGIFIEADAKGSTDAIKQACVQSLDALADLQTQFPDASLGLTLAFGSRLWQSFGHSEEGRDIKPFKALGGGLAPATQHDVLIHIQSLRHDLSIALAEKVLAAFGSSISVADETHSHRLLEERGFDGFVDGTENPQDEKRAEVAVIAEGADAGGSYVLLQKYRHDLQKWGLCDTAKQEACIGRSKERDEELEGDMRLPDSHLGRVDLKENGAGLKIVRRSLPYGTLSGERGLMFIAYCARLYNIEAQLQSMFGERDGQTDLMLHHLTTAVSGAYYYAPGVARLQNL